MSHSARVLAVQVAYSLSFAPVQDESQLYQVFRSTAEDFRGDEDVSCGLPLAQDGGQDAALPTPKAEAWELAKGVWEHLPEIDLQLEKYSHKRSLPRMGRTEKAILEVALYEMKYRGVPPDTIKHESARLAAAFELDEAQSFVRGILDAAARELKGRPPQPKAENNGIHHEQ